MQEVSGAFFVLMAGLEPARRKARDFKSPVSAIPPHQRTLLLYHARVEEVNAQLHHGVDICFQSVRE